MTLLPEVRQELYATAERAVARPPRRWRFGAGTLVLAGGTAVALLVAVVAVIGLSGGTRTVAVSTARPGSSSVRALEDRLAVLRRSQTAADRTYPASLRTRPHTQVLRFVPGLARLAAVVDTPLVARVRVFVIVRVVENTTVPGICGAGSGRTCPGRPAGRKPEPVRVLGLPGGRGTALVSLIAVAGRGLPVSRGPYRAAAGPASLHSGELMTEMQPASKLDQPGAVASGLIVAAGYGADPDVGVNMSLVPDGVTRVEWVFSGAAFGVPAHQPSPLIVPVHDNVAVAPVNPTEGPIVRAVWYGSSGKVIASGSADAGARQQLQLIRAVNASRRNALPRWLVDHYSLFRTVAPTTPVQDPTMSFDVQSGGGGLALNEWQVRHVADVSGLDGPGLWITPGAHGLCIDDPSAGGCGPYRRIRSLLNGAWTGGSTIAAPGEIGRSGIVHKWAETMNGLVPDGNATVTVLLAGGGRRVVPVIDNVWEVTVPRRIVALVDRNAAGRLMHWSLR